MLVLSVLFVVTMIVWKREYLEGPLGTVYKLSSLEEG